MREDLVDILQHAPDWWGTADKGIYDNLIFIMPPANFQDVYDEIGEPKEGLEKIQEYQKLSKAGEILSKIMFICCIVGFYLCIVGIVSMGLGAPALKLGSVTLKGIINTEAETTVGTIYTAMAVGLILCAGAAVLAKFAECYFKHELADGTPFTFSGAEELKRLGILTICIPVGTQIAAEIVKLISIISGWNYMPANARFTRILIAMLGNIIFLISILCMKDSWRAGILEKDKTRLVTRGIYQYSRNPAFLGFDLKYTGVLFMYCNPLIVAFSIFAMKALHLQILQEERYLEREFGEEYLEYKSRVFRYLGRRK